MKRDMDLIRALLLNLEAFESDGTYYGLSPWDERFQSISSDPSAIAGHLTLLIDAGFVAGTDHGGDFSFRHITWAGHDFVDAVRDEDIWRRTKAGALEAKGFTVDLLLDLAKGFIRKQVTARTGIEL